MKRIVLAVLLSISLPLAAQPADPHAIAEGDLAERFAAAALREEVAASDPHVARTRNWLVRAAQATGEEERAIAGACVRAAKFLLDSARVRANPLEVLEALAERTRPGQAMSESLMAYVDARKQAPNKTHAEAMAALRGTK